ncbi:hypothetical protein [Enterobacter sp.]|uniref:hypothetical protein n=1 Tax=Enterobacter sp. TaxID=42895 RepID=UPI00296E7B12|nr:hypothetical protein [Enterobacter sp.]
MKKVLIFFNAEPVSVLSVMRSVTIIRRMYPNGEEAHLRVMSAGFPSLTGDRQTVYAASDREITSEELLEAAKRFL